MVRYPVHVMVMSAFHMNDFPAPSSAPLLLAGWLPGYDLPRCDKICPRTVMFGVYLGITTDNPIVPKIAVIVRFF